MFNHKEHLLGYYRTLSVPPRLLRSAAKTTLSEFMNSWTLLIRKDSPYYLWRFSVINLTGEFYVLDVSIIVQSFDEKDPYHEFEIKNVFYGERYSSWQAAQNNIDLFLFYWGQFETIRCVDTILFILLFWR